jgi:hypothetical protein
MDKYVVFKISDWLDNREAINQVSNSGGLDSAYGDALDEALSLLDAARLDDAVVIRRQDVFAPPALDAYANAINAGVEVASRCGADLSTSRVEDLQRIAEYFHEQAAMAWDTNRKIPD